MKKSSALIIILTILVLFLGWKAYGDKINPFKNTPKDAVEIMFKAAIENNFELFVQSQSQQSLDRYAKKHGMTIQEVKEQTKKILAEGYKNLSESNVKLSDFNIYQPDDYDKKDYVSVKVKYVGKSNYIQENIEIPVYKSSDGNWYVSQDDEVGNSSIEEDVSNNDNKSSSRISDGGKGDGVWNINLYAGNPSDKVRKLTDEDAISNKENKNNNNKNSGLIPDSGDSSDQVFKLTDEERAHLYDVNGTNTKLTAKEARQLVLNEDNQYISRITDKNTKLSNDCKEYSAEDMPTKLSWNIPTEPCYVFYIDNYNTDGEVTDTSNEYLVGKRSRNVYIIPNQGGQSAYQIKNNRKVKTFNYIGEGGSQEWR